MADTDTIGHRQSHSKGPIQMECLLESVADATAVINGGEKLEGLDVYDLPTLAQKMQVNATQRAERRAKQKGTKAEMPRPSFAEWQQQLDVLLAQGCTDICIGYWRVSDIGQMDGFGRDVQIRHIIAWAETQKSSGLGLISKRGVDIWVFDVDSGRDESRIGFEFIRQAVNTTKCIKAVIAFKHDRLARNQHYAESINKELKANSCGIWSATENLPDGALGDLMRQMIQAIAQYESALIAQRLHKGREESIKQNGVFHGADAPFGYRLLGNRYSTGKGRMEICEPEAQVVRLVFTLYEKGYSQNAIADYLTRHGVPTRHAAKSGWHQVTIRDILRHERGYRAEGLFSKKVHEFEKIAHESILPTRSEKDRSYLKATVTIMRGVRVPDDIDDKPEIITNGRDTLNCLDPMQAQTLLKAVELSVTGLSSAEIVDCLNKDGLVSPTGRPWKECNLRRHLHPDRRNALLDSIARAGVETSTLDASLVKERRRDSAAVELAGIDRIRELAETEHLSLRKTAKMLAEEGFLTAQGGLWDHRAVDKVLRGKKRNVEIFYDEIFSEQE